MAAGYLQCDRNSTITWVSKLLPLGLGYWKEDAQIVSQELGVGTNAVPTHICKTCKLLLADYSGRETTL